VPRFTAEVLRERLVVVASEDPEHLIFFSRNHTPLLTNNVRRRLRKAPAEAGIQGVTPHSFRRTVATVIDRAGGADLAAEMLGHTSSEITRQHYIEPDETVNPATAEILEALAPRRRLVWGKPNLEQAGADARLGRAGGVSTGRPCRDRAPDRRCLAGPR
jgi:integrase